MHLEGNWHYKGKIQDFYQCCLEICEIYRFIIAIFLTEILTYQKSMVEIGLEVTSKIYSPTKVPKNWNGLKS